MLVSTGSVTNIKPTSADISGNILDLGEGALQHGHCFAITSNPTIYGTKVELGIPSIGNYKSPLTGLLPSKKYYVKAFISRGKEVVYGDEITFTTLSDALPVLTTTIITEINQNTAVAGGEITSEGGSPIQARGVCWNLTSPPTILNSKTSDGPGTGSFSSSISGLTPGTKYYVRAYATNDGGTGYGNELNFTSLPSGSLPTVITSEVTSITGNSASSGGNVTSGSGVDIKGVCWNTTGTPTVFDSKTTDGSGTGSFSSSLTTLIPGNTYYVRAYAHNSSGYAYADALYEYRFTTCKPPIVTTTSATNFTINSATINGTVDCNNSATTDYSSTVTFEYGPGTNYTNSIPATESPVGGNTSTNVSADLTGLTPGIFYHYRVKAVNCGGTTYGSDKSFIIYTESGINDSLLLCYSKLKEYVEFSYLFDAIYSNNVSAPNSTWTSIAEHTQTSNNEKVKLLWSDAYKIIYKTNFIIINSETVITDPVQRNSIIAQAKSIRAYLYYNLMIWFGGVPIELDVSEGLNPRNTTAEVSAIIEQNVTDAIQFLPWSWSDPDKFRITKAFSLAVSARTFLFSKQYSNAENRNVEIINSGIYSLGLDYTNFTSTNPEIFWGFAKSTNTEFNNFFTKGTFVPAIRLTESYLIGSETMLNLGNTTSALANINILYSRRGWAPLASLSNYIIFQQWLGELDKEGVMFVTMKRFDQALSILNIAAYKLLLPIPSSAMGKNPNLIQNLGY